MAEAQAQFDRGEWPEAEAAFGGVTRRWPEYDVGWRKLCQVRAEQWRRTAAAEACEVALALEDSAENLIALARAKVSMRAGGWPPRATRDEVAGLLRTASMRAPDDADLQLEICRVAWRARAFDRVEICGPRLVELVPARSSTWLFAALAASSTGDWDEIGPALDRAVTLGMDPQKARVLRRQLLSARPPWQRLLALAKRTALGWTSWVLALLAGGRLLGWLTLRVVHRLPGLAASDPLPGRSLRAVYSALLWCCGLTWYATLPLVAALILVAGGTATWFIATQTFQVYAAAAVGSATLLALAALLKGFFLPRWSSDEDPGEPLSAHPRLQRELALLQEAVGAPPIDKVLLLPGFELSVFHRGSHRATSGGRPERWLVLGGAVLDALRVGELRPLLAHELGHLATEGGGPGAFALGTRRLLVELAHHLVESEQDAWWNPTWQFLRLYAVLFHSASAGASRLHEVLADRRAVLACGSDGFVRAFGQFVRHQARFELTVGRVLRDVAEGGRRPNDLYAAVPRHPATNTEVDALLEKRAADPPSPYDSHPPDIARLSFARALGAATPASAPEDADPGWTLLGDPIAVRRRLTEIALRDHTRRDAR